jgi:hypothetical protein
MGSHPEHAIGSDQPSGPAGTEGGPDGLRLQARARGRDTADPPTLETAVPNWSAGDTIPLGRDRTLRVVGIVVSDDDEPSVLVVEDVAERASSAEL